VCAQVALAYDWILTLLQLAFPAIDLRLWYIYLLHSLVDLFLLVDIYLNFNLSYHVNSEKITDPARSAARYIRHEFALDAVLACPYGIGGIALAQPGWLRLPRLFRYSLK
jgi:hypothetical protein